MSVNTAWYSEQTSYVRRQYDELIQLVRDVRLAQRRAKRLKIDNLNRDSRRNTACEARRLTALLDRTVGLLPSE